MPGQAPPLATRNAAGRQAGPLQDRPETEPLSSVDRPRAGRWRAEFLFGLLIFAAAAAALAVSWPAATILATDRWPQVLFFVVLSLFTISLGFPHPVFGHVSFDRVAQVASILVLGPVDAAWVAVLASLLYPWHRLRQGEPLPRVIDAVLTNAGLMTLTVLLAGSLYAWLGGPVPLGSLDLRSLATLLLLILAMQGLNELGMAGVYYFRGKDPFQVFGWFETMTELVSGLIAILVAVVYTRMEPAVFVLLLVVMSAGMLGLRQFARMRRRLEQLVDARTEALREKTEQLEQLATRDMLTGLRNRRFAEEFVQREIELAQRTGRDLSVALADVDHFKTINDGHSHAAGDRVLQRLAQMFSDRVRGTDLVARYGGEEFLFCFTGAAEDMAAQVCEDLRRAVESADWTAVSPGLHVTMSVGIVGRGAHADAESLVHSADARLYRAKHMGRNLVVAEATVTRPSL